MLTSAQDPALQGGTPTVPASSQVAAPQAVVQPSATPSSVDMSNPEVQSLVEKARSEEKQKLYAEHESLRKQLAELRTQLEGKLTPDEKQTQRLNELQQQLQQATDRITALTTQIEEGQRRHAAETAQLRLQGYLDRRMREETAKGTKMLTELIGGASEQEIESSIQLAISEYQRLKAHFASEIQAEQPSFAAPVTPVSALPVATVVVPAPPGPSAFPTVPNAQAVPSAEPGTEGFTTQVANLTSPEAVRNGTYAQHRQRLLAGVRQGVVPPAGQPFANTPRVHIPNVQHGDVVQPQGLPTPPAANPHMAVVPPQPQLNPPQAQPVSTPTVPSPADFRAAAIDAATRGLARPDAHRATVVGSQPQTHSEYQLRPATTPPVFDGQHPMAQRGPA